MQTITDTEHSANFVLDPFKFFTFFSVVPKLDSGCYTAVTYSSLVEQILQYI